jgi:hypothetical protein
MNKITQVRPIMRQCIYSIPSHCGRCYTRETGRALGVCTEHMNNLKQADGEILGKLSIPMMKDITYSGRRSKLYKQKPMSTESTRKQLMWHAS